MRLIRRDYPATDGASEEFYPPETGAEIKYIDWFEATQTFTVTWEVPSRWAPSPEELDRQRGI